MTSRLLGKKCEWLVESVETVQVEQGAEKSRHKLIRGSESSRANPSLKLGLKMYYWSWDKQADTPQSFINTIGG